MRYWITILLGTTLALAAGCKPHPSAGGGPEVIPNVSPTGETLTTPKEYAAAAETAEANAAHWKGKAEGYRAGEKRALIRQRQHAMYWACGVCLFGALACAFGAVLLPDKFRKWCIGAGIAFVITAILAIAFAWVLAHIGIAVAVVSGIALAAAIVYWYRDRRALQNVVRGIEENVKPKLASLSGDMRMYMDEGSKRTVKDIRKAFGYKTAE